MDVVKFAYQVIDMQKRIDILEAENAELREYKQRYFDELHSSIEHGEKMMKGWVDLLLSDRITINAAAGEHGDSN